MSRRMWLRLFVLPARFVDFIWLLRSITYSFMLLLQGLSQDYCRHVTFFHNCIFGLLYSSF